MEDFFSGVADAQWPRQGRLHVYATPNDELRRTVAEYQAALGRDPAVEYGLGLVPARWLHATVQMLHPAVDELDQAQLDAVTAALRRRLAAVAPLTLAVGPPQASRHAVELWTDPAADEPWRGLVEAVRTAARDTLGAAALPPVDPGAVPHTSIAYGIGTGDSGAATSALKRVRAHAVMVPVEAVQLVAVHQHPEQGFFSWETLAELSLAAADRVGTAT